jgi:predicted glycoside hydrolase/deacetylase ChbG (UPF0249 family)
MHKPDFVDTADKVKERNAIRKRIREIQEKEAIQVKLQGEARVKNRKIGQLSLTETTLLNFTKKSINNGR